MKAKLFAEQNAGRRIRVKNQISSPNKGIEPWPYCRIVGYDDDRPDTMIWVEFENKKLHPYCFHQMDADGFVRVIANTHGNTIWRIKMSHIRFLRGGTKTKSDGKPVPYPNICRKCKQPSRNYAGYTLCSNLKCKTHAKRKAIVVPLYNYAKCKKCGLTALGTAKTKSRSATGGMIDQYKCANDHRWSAVFKKNDALVASNGGKLTTYVYDGATWQAMI